MSNGFDFMTTEAGTGSFLHLLVTLVTVVTVALFPLFYLFMFLHQPSMLTNVIILADKTTIIITTDVGNRRPK